MAEYSPDALRHLYDLIRARIPQAVLSGILGDASHTYGYHRGAAYIAASDYSRQFAEDKVGIDGNAASALDVSLPPDLMRVVSHRLMVACQANDPRLAALREWFGTENGTVVTGWDRRSPATPSDDCLTSSDDSHLWHVHFSIYRRYANDASALAGIADVVAGVSTSTDWFDMATPDDLRAVLREELPRIAQVLRWGSVNRAYSSKNAGALVDGKGIEGAIIDALKSLPTTTADAAAIADALAAKLGPTLAGQVATELSKRLAA